MSQVVAVGGGQGAAGPAATPAVGAASATALSAPRALRGALPTRRQSPRHGEHVSAGEVDEVSLDGGIFRDGDFHDSFDRQATSISYLNI